MLLCFDGFQAVTRGQNIKIALGQPNEQILLSGNELGHRLCKLFFPLEVRIVVGTTVQGLYCGQTGHMRAVVATERDDVLAVIQGVDEIIVRC